MVDIQFSSNAMLNSVIQHTLQKSIEAIGLPALDRIHFERELQQFIRSGSSTRISGPALALMKEDGPLAGEKMWQAVTRARIVVAEVWNHDTQVFYCRSRVRGATLDFRVSCRQHTWHLESLSLVDRPIRKLESKFLLPAVFAPLLVIAVFVGYWSHPTTKSVEPPVVVQTGAGAAAGTTSGSTGASSSSSNTGEAKTEANSARAGTDASKTGPNASKPAATKPAPKTVSVSLPEGMSLYDFAKRLQAAHLVSNAMSFDMKMKSSGVDKHLKPGTYVFRTGMSESDLIHVLQHGPTK